MSSLSDDNEEMSQDGIDAIDHVRKAEGILAASKRKKEAKLKAIEKEYRQKVEKAHTSFQKFLDDHKTRVSPGSTNAPPQQSPPQAPKRRNRHMEAAQGSGEVKKSTRKASD
ncbi:hypothetical protein V498_05566 [Pseudogymnoascus sp. VKM F-4517 (FW-2822)]|nr:hypothetical protein V498_05566 [Pseudogymnoascus sp. VKM F-4517 (FW-2822)]